MRKTKEFYVRKQASKADALIAVNSAVDAYLHRRPKPWHWLHEPEALFHVRADGVEWQAYARIEFE